MRTRRFAVLAVLAALPPLAGCARKDASTRADSGIATPPASAAAAANAADTKADEDSIRALSRRWGQWLATRDSAAIGALFAEDGIEYVPNAAPMRGPAAVTKGFGGMFRTAKDLKITFEPRDVSVARAGDVAVERGTYQMSWTDAKGKAVTDHGNYVTAWKKVNGQWKVFADINTSEVATPGT